MPDLLLEYLSEEIPSRMQARAADDLKLNFLNALEKEKLSYGKTEVFYSPRRLVISIENIPKKQKNIKIEKRGPRVDAQQNAIQGFLKSLNTSIDKLEKKSTDKGTFWFLNYES